MQIFRKAGIIKSAGSRIPNTKDNTQKKMISGQMFSVSILKSSGSTRHMIIPASATSFLLVSPYIIVNGTQSNEISMIFDYFFFVFSIPAKNMNIDT